MMRIPGSVPGGRKGARPAAVTGDWASRAVIVGRYLVVGVMLVGLAACSKSKSEPLVSGTTTPATTDRVTTTEAATTTTSTSTSTTTSTTVSASTQPAATTAPPTPGAPPVPTNEEWITILDALNIRREAMFSDPPNADVLSYCFAGSECETVFADQMANKVAKGQHNVDNSPVKVESIVQVFDVGATSNGQIQSGIMFEIHYTVVPQDSMGRIVDANGNTVAVLSSGDPTTDRTRTVVSFPSDTGLPWRFAD